MRFVIVFVSLSAAACSGTPVLHAIVSQQKNATNALTDPGGADPLEAAVLWAIPSPAAKDGVVHEGERLFVGYHAAQETIVDSLPSEFAIAPEAAPAECVEGGAPEVMGTTAAWAYVVAARSSVLAKIENGEELPDETPIAVSDHVLLDDVGVPADPLLTGMHLEKPNPDPTVRACEDPILVADATARSAQRACYAQNGCSADDVTCRAHCERANPEPIDNCPDAANAEVDASFSEPVELKLGTLGDARKAGVLWL